MVKLKVLRKSYQKNNPLVLLFYLIQLYLVKIGITKKIKILGENLFLKLRKGTSDLPVFREIFLEKEYELSFDKPINYIIDGGANIGVSTVYFSLLFPKAKILAVEPETNNFHALEENTSYSKNILPLKGGIWGHDTLLSVVKNENFGEWGFQTTDAKKKLEGNIVQCFSIDSLLEQYGFPTVDLLKLDIEGAEKNVFSNSNVAKWLPNIKYIIIELHDFIDSTISEKIFEVMNKHVFYKYYTSGENTIFEIIEKK